MKKIIAYDLEKFRSIIFHIFLLFSRIKRLQWNQIKLLLIKIKICLNIFLRKLQLFFCVSIMLRKDPCAAMLDYDTNVSIMILLTDTRMKVIECLAVQIVSTLFSSSFLSLFSKRLFRIISLKYWALYMAVEKQAFFILFIYKLKSPSTFKVYFKRTQMSTEPWFKDE